MCLSQKENYGVWLAISAGLLMIAADYSQNREGSNLRKIDESKRYASALTTTLAAPITLGMSDKEQTNKASKALSQIPAHAEVQPPRPSVEASARADDVANKQKSDKKKSTHWLVGVTAGVLGVAAILISATAKSGGGIKHSDNKGEPDLKLPPCPPEGC